MWENKSDEEVRSSNEIGAQVEHRHSEHEKWKKNESESARKNQEAYAQNSNNKRVSVGEALAPFKAMSGAILKSEESWGNKLLQLAGAGLYLLLNFAIAIGLFAGVIYFIARGC
jgi:hypothetical protein